MPMPRTTDPSVIEHRLLDLAYTTDSVITAPVLAFYAPCSIADAERVLDRLAAENRLEIAIDEDGGVHYDLPNRQRIPRPGPAAMMRAPPSAVTQPHEPNAGVAALLSALVPGAGQLYAGRPLAALGWFVVVSLGYVMLVVPGIILHVLCIASAASTAHQQQPMHA
jgi:TM2 domain-containing membrane protein YozV